MGWDVVIDGRVSLKDARGLTALREAAFELAPELGGAPRPFAEPIHVRPATAGRALDAITDEAFTVTARAGRLALSGAWDEDTFRDRAATLACVLSMAARRGATGELMVVAINGPALAFRLALSPAGVKVTQLPERAHPEISNAPWVADVMERAAATLAPPVVKPTTSIAPVDEALKILASLAPDVLFSCAADLPPTVAVRVKGRPVDQAWVTPTEAYPDPASLRAALVAPSKGSKASSDDWRLAFALPALAKHDPARAEPLALALLATDAPSQLVDSAVHALAHCRTDAAIEALFAALTRSALASFALTRNGHPSVSPRAIASLDDAAQRELYASEAFPGASLATRGGRLVLVLHGTRDLSAVPRLLEVWRGRGRSAAAHLVGSALVSMGTPEALTAVAEALGELDISVGKVAARAFLAIDPPTAFERATPFFASEAPASLRAAAALLDALTADASLDPRWLERASSVPQSSPLRRAAAWLIERAKSQGPS